MGFVQKLESACIDAVEAGKMTKDLAILIHGPKYIAPSHYVLNSTYLWIHKCFFYEELLTFLFILWRSKGGSKAFRCNIKDNE